MHTFCQTARAPYNPFWKEPQKHFITRLVVAVFLLAFGFTLLLGQTSVAFAVDKKLSKKDKALMETLTPIQESLEGLLLKVQSRQLLSPQESSELIKTKYQLTELMNDNPNNGILAKPVYQAGILSYYREQYEDALELFRFLVDHMPNSPYGLRAQQKLPDIHRKLGLEPVGSGSKEGAAPAKAPAVPGGP